MIIYSFILRNIKNKHLFLYFGYYKLNKYINNRKTNVVFCFIFMSEFKYQQ